MLRSMILTAAVTTFVFAAAASDVVIKPGPTSPTSATSGQEMYRAYCSSCHGLDAKGNGPAAPAMKRMPTDLTTLTADNHGKFPELHVYATIQGDGNSPVHGSKDMPVWGGLFQGMSHGNTAEVQLRISNLVAYIKGLQTSK